jgi:magnesium-transporting ATPase (P-type)
MEANIGIGIYGEEGMSAAQASDFAIGEFKLLKRLLFIHGRINLYRISKMILYFFYKNFVFTLIQFFFSFYTLSSGQTIIDDWYITCYNLVFTAFPLCISAITDTDIDINDQKEKKKNFALLYKENRDKYRVFSFSQFILKLIKGIIISLTIFYLSGAEEILYQGRTQNIWVLSLKNYISTLIIVSANLLINTNYIVLYLPLSIGITTFLLFIIFLVLNHYGVLFTFNSKASIFPSFYSCITYLSLIITCFFSILLDYTSKLVDIYFSNKLSSKLILEEMKEDKRKSLFGMNSKSYTRQSKEKRINSLPMEARSNSYLISQGANKLKLLNNNEKTPKSNIMNVNLTRTKDNSKKLITSLKYIKKINVSNDNNDNSEIKK